jgi:phosphatidate cytidylyltransferase
MARSELAQRWLVALIGIPTAVALAWVGRWALGPVLAVFCAGAAVEVYRLAATRGVQALQWPGAVAAAAVVMLAAAFPSVRAAGPVLFSFIVGFLLLISALAVWRRSADGRPLLTVAVTAIGTLVPAGTMAFVVFLRHLPVEPPGSASAVWPTLAGVALVAYPLAVTWMTDTGAFFGGRRWGRRKLAPVVSPGKTIEGAVAGLAGGTLAGWLVAYLAFGLWLGLPVTALEGAVGGLLISLVSQLGDLAESAWKREAGVKDSGTIFPGHGGVLDRMDALMFTMPASFWWLAMALPGVSPW